MSERSHPTASRARVEWGVLGTARIATAHVIPAIQTSARGRVLAVASRDIERARAVAARFDIPRAYGSYEELIGDRELDVVYNPLPNHLHVRWSVRALDAGKHVLCEKPIAMTTAEAQPLAGAAARHAALHVMEAFMYRYHPQWQRARQLVADGAIGELRAVHTWFSYANTDARNIRNVKEAGGGALMDIGCYGVSVARFLAGGEPLSVVAASDVDSVFGVDRLTSAMMDFGGATATFICATQVGRHQRVDVGGSTGTISIEAPFNPPIDRACTMVVRRGDRVEVETFERVNQYERQAEAFNGAVLGDSSAALIPLSDSIANMRVIDAIRASAAAGRRVDLASL